jgi:hypothetical protein
MALGATGPHGFLSYGLVSSSSAGLRGSVQLYGAQRRLLEFSNQVLTLA